MENLLPVVNPEVGFSIARDIPNKDNEFINRELALISKENPAVANFIKNWSEQSSDPLDSMFCGIIVYKLLRSQAEVDRMEDII